jgi:hypothetical protein
MLEAYVGIRIGTYGYSFWILVPEDQIPVWEE